MSFKLLADLVVLLLLLGTTAIVLLGWGSLTWRILGIEQPNKPSTITAWLGFCIVVGCLEIIHLFVQIDWKVTLAFAVIGALGCQLNSNPLAVVKDNQSTDVLPASGMLLFFFNWLRRYPFRSCLAAIVVIVWCFRAMEVPTMYDSGLYHFGSIRWLNEYPIVPGLGNLHWRLALNQSYFGFLALLNIAPFWGKGYAAGGLFLLLLTVFTLLEVGTTQSRLWRWIFGGVLFSYLCLLSGPIANPMPDTAVALLQIVIFVFLYLNCVSTNEASLTSAARFLHLQIVLALLCLTIVTVKLSSVGFAVTCFAIVNAWALRSFQHKVPNAVVARTVALLGLFTFVHISRGYLLSGAPFFPSPIGSIWSMPWAVEFGVAQNESQLIYAWAKQPGIGSPSALPANFEWFNSWFAALPKRLLLLMAVSTALNVISLALFLKYRNALTSKLRGVILMLPIITASGFWFMTAPDIRFLGAIPLLYFIYSVWLLGVIALSLLADALQRFAFLAQGLSLTLTVLCFFRWSVLGVVATSGWTAVPLPDTKLQITRSGLTAWVPQHGQQCWSGPIPCAILLHDSLRRYELVLPNWLQSIVRNRLVLTTK